jgi:hypothetical protein
MSIGIKIHKICGSSVLIPVINKYIAITSRAIDKNNIKNPFSLLAGLSAIFSIFVLLFENAIVMISL